MTHTDDLRERVKALIDRAMTFGDGYSQWQVDMPWSRHLEMATNDIIAAVHADIAARALSDEVVEAGYKALFSPHYADEDMSHMPEVISALLTALRITESEEE